MFTVAFYMIFNYYSDQKLKMKINCQWHFTWQLTIIQTTNKNENKIVSGFYMVFNYYSERNERNKN